MTELIQDAFTEMDAIFHPRSIAFVGITISNPSHWTRSFWEGIHAFNFDGPMYPINPNGGELDGCKVYKSLDEVPCNIDYVISTVSSKIAPEIIIKCARKGVKAIHFCTAGFGETGHEDLVNLQSELTRIAGETGIRIIGPNCLGLYCPESRISFAADFPRDSGTVAYISQSGTNCACLINGAGWRGVRFSKVISFGNGCDLNESDYLEYLTDDPNTKIIALYLEGVKDGRRFFNAMKRASEKKTVVLLKGGNYGEAGSRAAATHTASLAGNSTVWETLCNQLNIINTDKLEELADILVTLYLMPDPGGPNAIVIGPGGGSSLLLTDAFEKAGLRLPLIPDSIRNDILSFSQLAGNMLHNPVDYSQSMRDSSNLVKTVKLLAQWKEADFFTGFFRTSAMESMPIDDMFKLGMSFLEAYTSCSKPFAFILEPGLTPMTNAGTFKVSQEFVKAGIPLYGSFTGAAESIAKVIRYNQVRRSRAAQ